MAVGDLAFIILYIYDLNLIWYTKYKKKKESLLCIVGILTNRANKCCLEVITTRIIPIMFL